MAILFDKMVFGQDEDRDRRFRVEPRNAVRQGALDEDAAFNLRALSALRPYEVVEFGSRRSPEPENFGIPDLLGSRRSGATAQ